MKPTHGTLVPATVSGIRVERWQRTVTPLETPVVTRSSGWHASCFVRAIMSRDDSPKVDRTERVHEQRQKEQSFQELLKKAPVPDQRSKAIAQVRPPPLPALRSSAVAKSAAIATTENLGRVRSTMHADASRMVATRTEGQLSQEQKIEGRVLDLIVKELASEFSDGSAKRSPPEAQQRQANQEPTGAATPRAAEPVSGGNLSGSQSESRSQDAALKAQAAVALVQKIEAFVKSQRPALAITVSGVLEARVEVEKTGANEVALKVVGKHGPPAPEDVARIREALRERGLKLSNLSVG